MKYVFENIDKVIKERGIKQNWVERRAGMPKGAISSLRRSHSPRLEPVVKIARALGLDINEIIIDPKGIG